MIGLLVALVIVGFSIKLAIGSGGGNSGLGGGGGALAPDVVTQAQSICSDTFAPPLIRFPPEGGAVSAATAASVRAKVDSMITQLEPAITSKPVSGAFALITSYRNLDSALASFPPTGGDAAEQNVMQLASGVSD